jgi:hypothetical protein
MFLGQLIVNLPASAMSLTGESQEPAWWRERSEPGPSHASRSHLRNPAIAQLQATREEFKRSTLGVRIVIQHTMRRRLNLSNQKIGYHFPSSDARSMEEGGEVERGRKRVKQAKWQHERNPT